ncbi:hypothetical protein [Ligilactobacillus sp. Marseille-Q7487]|uniref:hypothetical protein n=1 Tax=Ligilactobacillus sp. Marseille-Q7487 TaxID=3022128 RepID=UPI0024A93472|nr:hypothetical protein [Ligilactobacillus sp. Marseille-Q7487]
MLFFKKTDYEVVAKQDGEFTVRIKGKPGQTITVGEVILDLNNDQYNSDHRFYRHQDSFFQSPSDEEGVENDSFSSLADRVSIEVTSTYGTEAILDQLIAQENEKLVRLLIEKITIFKSKIEFTWLYNI